MVDALLPHERSTRPVSTPSRAPGSSLPSRPHGAPDITLGPGMPHPTPPPHPPPQPWGPEPGPSSRFLISPRHMASRNGGAAPLGGCPGPFRPHLPHTSSSCFMENTTAFCRQSPNHQHPTLFSSSVGHIPAPPHNDPVGTQDASAARSISPRHPSPTQGATGPHRDQDRRPNQSWHPQLTALAPTAPAPCSPSAEPGTLCLTASACALHLLGG